MRLSDGLAGTSMLAWAYLLVGHGAFWLTHPRLRVDPPPPTRWPRVAAVVPARNEATVLPQTLSTLLGQDYPGELAVWLVDDASTDRTARVARALADGNQGRVAVTVLSAPPPTQGWTGKLNALAAGVAAASAAEAEFLLFTDADIAHHPASVSRLVAAAVADDRDLVSLMALLRTESGWERLLVPAFVYFFAQLYPFGRVSRPDRRTAAAAGGCVLLRGSALGAVGGLASIRGELIDDVALGRLVKRAGFRTWLGFTGDPPEVRSVRPYPRLADLWAMVARSAYTQLRHSPALLAGTVAGLGVLYGAPPVAALIGVVRRRRMTAATGIAGWAAMALSQGPVLRRYRLSPLRGLALPAVAAVYTGIIIDSARRQAVGRGGVWKGRSSPLPLR